MPNYHVIKDRSREKDQWIIKKDNAERISGAAVSQRLAEKMAKEFCENAGGGEVRTHGLDGKIRDSDTVKPGNDPCPPTDRRH